MDTTLRDPAGYRRDHHLEKGITDGLGTCTCQASHKTHFLCCTRRCIPNLWGRKKKRVCLQNTSGKKDTQIYFKHLERLNIYIILFFLFLHAKRLYGSQASLSDDPPQIGEIVKLPLAMPVAISIKTTTARCIVIRKRHLSLLQNRAEETPNSSLCEGEKEQHAIVYPGAQSSIEIKNINIKWNF